MKIIKILITVFVFGISNMAFTSDIYAGCFTREIYEQAWIDDLTLEHTKLKIFCSRKRACVEKKLIEPLLEELSQMDRERYEYLDRGFFKLVLSLCLVGVDPTKLSFALGGSSACYQMLERNKINSIHQSKQEEKQAEIEELMREALSGPIAKLEKKYVIKKHAISQSWQDTIEGYFLRSYDSGKDYTKIISDLISFPSKVSCLSEDGDSAKYRRNLKAAKLKFKKNLLLFGLSSGNLLGFEAALTSLAKATINTFKKSGPTRCAIYFHNQVNAKWILSAFYCLTNSILRRPCKVINARKEDILDKEYCFGQAEIQPGIFLEPFLKEHEGKYALNPVLIISNIDCWMKKENLGLLLQLFDPEATHFHSEYFDLDVDWSAMSILCWGTTPAADFDPAIQSRLQEFVIR